MKHKLRLGMLGTGVAARLLYWPALERLRSKVELVACANRTRKKAERYARLTGIPRVVDSAEELFALPDVDAVLISLPIAAQPPLILKALASGKAVLSEKPVASTVAEARKLLKATRRYDAPWLVGENFAFMPHIARLREWLRAGRLGAIRFVEARQITLMNSKNPYFSTPWRHADDFSGGFVVDGGVHLANAVRRCFGMPVSIRALSARLDASLPPPDTAVAALAFESGALGTWTSCFNARYTGPMLRVFGSKAEAELYWSHVVLRTAQGREIRFDSPENSFYIQFAHFVDVVQKGVAPEVTPEDALEDLALVEAIATASDRVSRNGRSTRSGPAAGARARPAKRAR